MSHCLVSYLDLDGVRHSVEVEAQSLYEAACLAIKVFREHDCEPAPLSKLEITIPNPVTHEVTYKKVVEWLRSGAKSPKDVIEKDRLRELIEIEK